MYCCSLDKPLDEIETQRKRKKMAKVTRILFHPEILNTCFQTVQSNRTLKKSFMMKQLTGYTILLKLYVNLTFQS